MPAPDLAPSPAPGDVDAPALEVRGLRKSYAGREVVRGLNLVARRGELTAVLGPNGAGKTTTIECCEGLRRPDGGAVSVLGLDRSAPGADARLRERVGVMLQDGGLPMAPRAAAVLNHVAQLHVNPVRPGELLARLGLTDAARTTVRRLSGGQRQRLALATAVVGRPELVFLDEPSAGLDPQSRLAVWELLRELRAGGTSIVLTTHSMTEAEELADKVVVIDEGRVVAEGTPAGLTGGPTVRVTPPARVTAAQVRDDLAARLAAAGRGDLVVTESGDVVDVAADGTAAGGDADTRPVGHVDAGTLAAVSAALTDAGLADAGVSLHRRTLEDVFLELTGHRLRTVEEDS